MNVATVVACISEASKRTCHVVRSMQADLIPVGDTSIGVPDTVHCTQQDNWSCWDIGIDIAVATGHDGVILVGDGCIPQNGLVESHRGALCADYPIMTIGRCLCGEYGWKDSRDGKVSKHGDFVNNVSMVTGGMVACPNMGLNMGAIRRLRALHMQLLGQDRVFPMFDFGHRIGYAAWCMHICMWYLPYGANAVKICEKGVGSSVPGQDDPYLTKLRAFHVDIGLL